MAAVWGEVGVGGSLCLVYPAEEPVGPDGVVPSLFPDFPSLAE